MRKSEWVLVAVLVFSGLSCLSMSAGGLIWEAESGWRSTIAKAILVGMPYLIWLACALVLWVLGSYAISLIRPVSGVERCPVCHRTVESTWRRCPYCETALKHKEA